MQFINYFFASIISFLGLLAGVILVEICPEEQKPLERFFNLSRKIILMLVFLFLFFYYANNIVYALILIGFFLFLLFMQYKISNLLKKSMLTYALLGILFYLSSKNTNLFVIESSLLFLYGLPAASLMYSRKEKNHYVLLFYNIGFVITANLAFFV
ncbi:MAG: hypothetical protein AABX33_03675 [Nanoarchaeota archaeon]